MNSKIKVLSKVGRLKSDLTQVEASDEESTNLEASKSNDSHLDIQRLKHESEARTFKLIDGKDWNIVSSEPDSETTFFQDGHSAMSIISVIGSKGSGKSSLLNSIARKEVFQTNQSSPTGSVFNLKHVTRGIDIYSDHHRMLLDCQPVLAASVFEDFLTGHSNSQFPKNSQLSDPSISCQIISLQLATFLIATSDYVIVTSQWLIDIHLIKLIASAIMMIGEDNIRAKIIIYSNDERVSDKRFEEIIENSLGQNKIHKYFHSKEELINYVTTYSSEKCESYMKDPSTFTGRNWLTSCRRLWNTTIKNSSMFSDYASQLVATSNINF